MFGYVPGLGIGQRLLRWRYLNGWGRLDAVGQFLAQLSAIAFLCSGAATILIKLGAGHSTSTGRSDLVIGTIVSAGTILVSLLVRVVAGMGAAGHSDICLEKSLPASSSRTSDRQSTESGVLVLPRRLARKSAKTTLYMILVTDIGGITVVFMLAASATGVKVAGLVVLVALIAVLIWIYRSGQRRADQIYAKFPTFEATEDELRMINHDGSVMAAPRSALDRAVQLDANPAQGSRLQFRDSRGRELTHWDLDRYLKKAVIPWVRGLGYDVAVLGGTRAREEVRAHDTLQTRTTR